MQYIPKSNPLIEIRVPDIYDSRVNEDVEAIIDGNFQELFKRKEYLANQGIFGVIQEFLVYGKYKGDKIPESAKKAYDILYLNLLIKEIEHDRDASDSEYIRSGESENHLIELLQQIKEISYSECEDLFL